MPGSNSNTTTTASSNNKSRWTVLFLAAVASCWVVGGGGGVRTVVGGGGVQAAEAFSHRVPAERHRHHHRHHPPPTTTTTFTTNGRGAVVPPPPHVGWWCRSRHRHYGRRSPPPGRFSSSVVFSVVFQAASTTMSASTTITTTSEAKNHQDVDTAQNNNNNNNSIPRTTPPPAAAAVGLTENEKFDCDASVEFWRRFASRGHRGNLDGIRDVLWRNNAALAIISNNNNNNDKATTTTTAAAYWSSHLLRTAYFTATAALGTVASDLHERFSVAVAANDDDSNNSNGNSDAATPSFLSPTASGTGSKASNLLSSDVPSRLLLEALLVYEQEYDRWIRSGVLRYPWDAAAAPNVVAARNRSGSTTAHNSNNNNINHNIRLQWDHRQMNPLFALSETARVVRESVAIFRRRNRYGGRPSRREGSSAGRHSDGNSNNHTGDVFYDYPEYYLNDFHYQTDGWLSAESAQNYEASTETLFLGRQDAMQRQTLIPMLKHFRQQQQESQNGSSTKQQEQVQPLQIFEVAAGTGRFATFLRDNFPLADLTLTDLSPFYLEKASQNDKYWRDYRGRRLAETAQRPPPKPATLVQANAEALPFFDSSFDAVACVYLFHELPRAARENAARELARVLKPGGILSLTDSVQAGDRPSLDARLGAFGALNEPHYADYTVTPLPPLFERHGLECGEKYIASNTKTLSFVKNKIN